MNLQENTNGIAHLSCGVFYTKNCQSRTRFDEIIANIILRVYNNRFCKKTLLTKILKR